MGAFQTPITIGQALDRIKDKDYLLPAFQREFVWKPEQIEILFDSLMQNYPISSMLFWKVKGKTSKDWKFYEFIDNYVAGAKDKVVLNKLCKTHRIDFTAILDGQQRLTAMKIGLYGTYAYRESGKWKEYSEKRFPTRKLYLNLSDIGDIVNDRKYEFKFLKISDTKDKVFYKELIKNGNKTSEKLWFKVGEIKPYNDSGDDAGDYFENQKLTKEQKNIINKLKKVIFTEQLINFYEEDEQNPDKAVNIFTRINSGGTSLPFSDIVFSLMVSNWEKVDARTEVEELIQTINNIGFEISKDYIIKAFLYLYNGSVVTEIKSFNNEFCKLLESEWPNIKQAMIVVFKLLRSFGMASENLTSNNATLPILYYLYHKNVYSNFNSAVKYKDERKEIKKWLYIVLIRKLFGTHSDAILTQSRESFGVSYKQMQKGKYVSEDFTFNSDAINKKIKRIVEIDDETLEDILDTQKDNKLAFLILSLLYPYLDYKNNDFHKDHMHADSLYENLTPHVKAKITYKQYNSIVNLQMLDSNENESKGAKSLEQWVNDNIKGYSAEERKQFMKKHIIPDVSLKLSNFEEFYLKRKEMLIKLLKKALS